MAVVGNSMSCKKLAARTIANLAAALPSSSSLFLSQSPLLDTAPRVLPAAPPPLPCSPSSASPPLRRLFLLLTLRPEDSVSSSSCSRALGRSATLLSRRRLETSASRPQSGPLWLSAQFAEAEPLLGALDAVETVGVVVPPVPSPPLQVNSAEGPFHGLDQKDVLEIDLNGICMDYVAHTGKYTGLIQPFLKLQYKLHPEERRSMTQYTSVMTKRAITRKSKVLVAYNKEGQLDTVVLPSTYPSSAPRSSGRAPV